MKTVVIDIIRQKMPFITECIPYDFTKNMGQYALEVRYSNGEMDMFTTPMPPGRGSDKGDFISEEEYFETLEYLRTKNLVK